MQVSIPAGVAARFSGARFGTTGRLQGCGHRRAKPAAWLRRVRRSLPLIGGSFLIACSPVSVILPSATPDQIAYVQDAIARSPNPAPVYASEAESLARISRIYDRLYPSAVTVCEHIGQDDCRWDLRYSDQSDLNAYATGTDQIVILKGVVDYAPSDEELALVIAHEMSHHIANHLSETQGHAALGALIFGAIAAYATRRMYYSQDSAQQFISDSAELGAHIGARSYSKQQEREADYLATYILAGAGFDLEKAEAILVTLVKSKNQRVRPLQGFLGTHPSGPERLANWRIATKEIGREGRTLPRKRGAE